MTNPYDIDLDRNPANFQPLTPLTFLERAAAVFSDHTAIIHGPLRRSYAEFYARARQLASSLARRGIERGDTVSVLLANTPAMLECHYGVPMSAAVLNTINTRLDAATVAFQLDHADAKVLIADREFSKLAEDALALAKVKPLVVAYDDAEYAGPGERLGDIEYEEFITAGDPEFAWAMYDAIADHKVTHLCGAPIVMATLLNAPAEEKKPLPHVVEFFTAAAPPPEAVLAAMKAAGFNVTHLYGLTETYGPAAVNEWRASWDALSPAEQAAKKARQGVRYVPLEGLDVRDPETLKPVPWDGESMGEVMFRGNVVMKGYLKNKSATEKAFAGGWFHSGDLGVMHADGYIQLKDRSKDIIISGGENISSIEVEDSLYKHPAVAAAAVVAKPDDQVGENPCAIVDVKPGEAATREDLIAWCRKNLAGYKCPRYVVFTELPRTSTGKIQKFKLREMAKAV